MNHDRRPGPLGPSGGSIGVEVIDMQMYFLILLGVAINTALLVWCVRTVWRFNARMPELWRLLETKGRGHRVRELRDDPRTNLPAAKYLYDEVDFDDADIRELKLTLKAMHRSGILSILVLTAGVIGTLSLYEHLA